MSLIKIQESPSLPRPLFRNRSRIGVLVDENTIKHCYPLVRSLLPEHVLIKIPAGETHKNLETCTAIWQQLTDQRFDRHALLVALGGGVTGDMGGFCAATFKRGIDFILLPTTLLAQVDASIGGKLGIDFGPYKNHIGVFKQPVATLIATGFLKTLPERELCSGYAEVIKHCLISDKRMWEKIQKQPLEKQPWLKLVRHSVAYKSLITKKDPRESGLRKVLNFGHTLGHGLEGHFISTEKPLFHGEAIAAGMVLESRIARLKKLLSDKEVQAISGYILSVYGKIELPRLDKILPLVKQDKKNKGNTIFMALPEGIGKAVWDIPVSEREILDAMDFYRSFQT
ncbi:MAG TPA: 3-dehydroquinate synthase [Cyclobacteriaceae bacterium]|nr:3-dehydroquinate synthase [Cyclobacteriaceae bacterium]